MDSALLARLCSITPEEQAILDGRTTIDRDLYMQGMDNTVNSRKLLSSGKLITLRPHTRFIDFPRLCGNGVYVLRADHPFNQ